MKKAIEALGLEEEIRIEPLQLGRLRLRIVGTTPLYQNRLTEKYRQEMLVGSRPKTRADRAQIRHQPQAEFRAAAEIAPSGPTALGLRTVAVKAAMAAAALETGGVTKASVQRLLTTPAGWFPVWGIPRLKLDVVRDAGIARTPNIRSRCFLPRWAAEVEIAFVMPQFGSHSVVNLLANAGVVIGVGDFRQQKGAGSFGSFRVLGEGQDDSEWSEIVAEGGRAAQLAALDRAEPADEETRELLEFHAAEVRRRSA